VQETSPRYTNPVITQAPLVIIGCGARKTSHPAPAAKLYTGSYFTACLSAARALAPDDRVFILSAKHGLLPADGQIPIAPYDLKMNDPGSVTPAEVRYQAARRNLLGRPVTALCSARYADVCRKIWEDVDTPLAGLGIGDQRHVLAEIRRETYSPDMRSKIS
jgi:hypothetical protein